MARRTITADVASRRHRTAVTTNAGLSEYGFTKFDVTPDGRARAGTRLLGLLLLMMPLTLTLEEVARCNAQVKTWKDDEKRCFCSLTSTNFPGH